MSSRTKIVDNLNDTPMSSGGVTVVLPLGGYSDENFAEERLQYLREVFDDLRAQTLTPDQLIVSVNGNVGSVAFKEIESLVRDVGCPVLVTRAYMYLPASENFNRAVALVQTDYFTFWSDHDRHQPDFLERLVGFLRANPAFGLAASCCEHHTESGRSLGRWSILNPMSIDADAPVERCMASLRANANLIGSAYGVFRTEVYSRCNKIYRCYSPDLALAFDITQYSKIVVLPELLWSQMARHSALPAMARHAEFLDNMDALPAHRIPATHRVLCYMRLIDRSTVLEKACKKRLMSAVIESHHQSKDRFIIYIELAQSMAYALRSFVHAPLPWGYHGQRNYIFGPGVLAFQFGLCFYGVVSGSVFREIWHTRSRLFRRLVGRGQRSSKQK